MNGPAKGTSAARATLWSALDFISERTVGFGIIVLLARLLTPAEFGTVAMLAIFVGVSGVLVESGLSQALIQRRNITDEDTSTVFWLNIGVAGGLALLMALCAPLIARFFAVPVLVPLTRILAGSVFVGAFAAVQRALLVKRMAFRQIAVVRTCSSLGSGVIAVILAWKGFGVFSLAVQTLSASIITTGMLWLLSGWRPRFLFRLESARRLFGFGGYMLVSSLLEMAYSRTYTLLIGKFNGSAALGQFSRAEGMTAMLSGLVTYPMSQVTMPIFARFNGDLGLMADGMRRGLRIATAVNAPAMLGLAVLADPFVHTVFGPQWDRAVHLLQVLCLGGLLMPVHVLNLQMLMSLGRSDLFFWFELWKKAVGIAVLVVSSFWGPEGVAWGVVATGVLASLINMSQSRKLIGYGMVAQIGDTMPIILAAAAMAGCVWLLAGNLPQLPGAARLVIGAGFGASLWSALVLAFDIAGLRQLLARRWPVLDRRKSD